MIYNSPTSLTVVITNPGSGYTAAPTLLFSGGGGTVTTSSTSLASNSFTGGVLLGATNVVVVSDSSALGTGTIGFNGTNALSQLVANNTVAFSNPYIVSGGFMTVGGTSSAANVTFSGPGTLTANAILIDNNLGTVTLSGNLGDGGGPRSLTVVGPGAIAFTGANNTFAGGFTLASHVVGNSTPTQNSVNVTVLTTTVGLYVGMPVSGGIIPAGATIGIDRVGNRDNDYSSQLRTWASAAATLNIRRCDRHVDGHATTTR